MTIRAEEVEILINELSKPNPDQKKIQTELKRLKIKKVKDPVDQLNQVMWSLSQATIDEKGIKV